MFAPKGGLKQTLKTILNPCFVAVVVGFAMFSLDITLPALVQGPAMMLADMTIPLALLFIGCLLAQNVGAMRRIDKDVLLSVAAKTLLAPLLVFVVLTALGIDPTLVLLSTVLTALPVPLLCVMFAKEFGKDVAFVNVAFMFSTLMFILLAVGLSFFL